MGTKVRATLVVAAMGLVMLLAPASVSALTPPLRDCMRSDNASYGCNVGIGSLYTYKGWAHVESGMYCGGAAPSEDLLARLRAPRPAWRWTAYGWSATSVATGTQVYVWPYATGWSWAWTQRTGWLAMQDQYLVINPYTDCGRFPLPVAR